MNDRELLVSLDTQLAGLRSQIAVQVAAPGTPATPATPTPPPATPPPIPAGGPCPPYSGAIDDFGPAGPNVTITMQSGQIGVYRLPDGATLGRASARVGVAETTGTAPGSVIEMMISKCPGVIDPTAGRYYYRSSVQNLNAIVWFREVAPPFTSLKQITDRGYCWAPAAEGPWYLNVRWTYPVQPSWGFGRYVFQWGAGPY